MSSTQEAGEIFGEGKGPAQAMLRSPTVLIASVGLWGMNLFFFRLFGIDYVHVFHYDLVRLDADMGDANGSLSNLTGNIGGGIGNGASATNGNGTTGNNSKDLKLRDHAELAVAAAKELEDDDYNSLFDSNFYNSPDNHRAVTWYKLVALSFLLLLLLHFTIHTWIDIMGGGSIGAVFAFYATVAIGISLPLTSTQWLRKAAWITLQRTCELINPRCSCVTFCLDKNSIPRPIPFVDVFVADAMCSLSKVFFDWGMLWHMATHYPNPVPPSAHNILIPSAFAAVPYVIRARQCIIMYNVTRLKGDPKRFSHLWNALKYSTSIFPLCLSAYQKTVGAQFAERLEPLLIFLVTVNALYALYWDIVMDWGMMQNPTAVIETTCIGGPLSSEMGRSQAAAAPTTGCCRALLRPKLRFGICMSVVIVVADALLRFSWLLRFYDDRLFPSGDHFVLATQFLEVFRRAIWNLLRVEWENIKQVREQKNLSRNDLSSLMDEEKVSFLSAPISLSMAPLPKVARA